MDPNEIDPNEIASIDEINPDEILSVEQTPAQPAQPAQAETAQTPIVQTRQTLANPDPKVAMDVTGNQFWTGITNRASMGLIPLAEDAVRGFVKDPMGAVSRATKAGRNAGFPLNPFGAIDMAKGAAGDENKARQFAQEAQEFGGPGATVAGSIVNPTNLIPVAGFTGNALVQAGQDQVMDSTGQDQGGIGRRALNAGMAGLGGKLVDTIQGGAKSFDDFLTQKVGPAALDWVNKMAERVVMQGTNQADLVQNLRGQPSRLGLGSAFDDVKWQLIEKLKPGVTEDYNVIADRLAKQSSDAQSQYNRANEKMTERDALISQIQSKNDASIADAAKTNEMTAQAAKQINEGRQAAAEITNSQQGGFDPLTGQPRAPRFGQARAELVTPVAIEPELQAVPRRMPVSQQTIGNMERASNLETIMSPGVNEQMSRGIKQGFATTPTGIIANNLIDSGFRRTALATMKGSQAVAQKALGKLNVDMNMAPFQRDMIAQKLQTISQMQPSKANAYSYAESLINPLFRQIWLDAQKEQDNESN